MERSNQHNLQLSGVDVNSSRSWWNDNQSSPQQTPGLLLEDADVIFLHVGGNKYRNSWQLPTPMNIAQDILDLELDIGLIYGDCAVIIVDMARFPVHQTYWCTEINKDLQQLVATVAGQNISLWRQRWSLQLEELPLRPLSCTYSPVKHAGLMLYVMPSLVLYPIAPSQSPHLTTTGFSEPPMFQKTTTYCYVHAPAGCQKHRQHTHDMLAVWGGTADRKAGQVLPLPTS